MPLTYFQFKLSNWWGITYLSDKSFHLDDPKKQKSRWHNLFQPYSNGILIFSGKSKTYLRGLGNELSVQRRWLGLFSIFYFYTSCGYNSIKSEIKDTLNVQNTWTVKLPKIGIYKIRRKKSIREINVPAVSTAVTVDTWRAFKDPTLVLRLKYLTGLWANNDLWLYGICNLPDLTLLSSTAEILILGTPRLPETRSQDISYDDTRSALNPQCGH